MSYVKDFIENAVPTYADDPDAYVDNKTMFYYYRAVDELKGWVKKILLKELAETEYTDAYAKLYLPTDDLKIDVSCETFGASSALRCMPEIFYTPIGELDYETYQAIINQEDNPVKMFYEHLSMLVKNLRVLYPQHDDSLLRGEFLKAEKVRDVLGLHRMESVLYDIAGFLDGRYWLSRSELE